MKANGIGQWGQVQSDLCRGQVPSMVNEGVWMGAHVGIGKWDCNVGLANQNRDSRVYPQTLAQSRNWPSGRRQTKCKKRKRQCIGV